MRAGDGETAKWDFGQQVFCAVGSHFVFLGSISLSGATPGPGAPALSMKIRESLSTEPASDSQEDNLLPGRYLRRILVFLDHDPRMEHLTLISPEGLGCGTVRCGSGRLAEA